MYDLAIIGGGINGVAIARDAAMRGMEAILFEKEDFGFGASTKTSKLAHGGLRYLEHYEFGLVRESMHERHLLLKNAPHLVVPLAFVLPIYQNDPHFLWQIKLGLFIYDYFGRESGLPKYKNLTKDELVALFPGIKTEGLKGGCLYYDALMRDNRLVIENMLSAKQFGGKFCSYTSVIGINREVTGEVTLSYLNRRSHLSGKIRAKAVVNSTGAWSDQVLNLEITQEPFRVSPTKGVHLVISQLSENYALILHAPQDQRVFFLIPWEGNTLLGTTDTSFTGDPDHVETQSQDKEYLLSALSYYFPHLPQEKARPLASFVGLRPLIAKSTQTIPYLISRTHQIHISQSRLISVLGGKFTTHRKIAQDVVDIASELLGKKWGSCRTASTPLMGANDGVFINHFEEFKRHCFQEYSLTEEQTSHLFFNYGSHARKILHLIDRHPEEKERICPHHPHLVAEITYAIMFEHALTLEDWFFRRTSVAYTSCRGKHCLAKVANTFARLLKWDDHTYQQSCQKYLKIVK